MSPYDFAVLYHGTQKYGDKPYSYHLEKVAEISKTKFQLYQIKWIISDEFTFDNGPEKIMEFNVINIKKV